MIDKMLSQTMQNAVSMAQEAKDQSLHRWPGGYWTDTPWEGPQPRPADIYMGRTRVPENHYGTQTVDALISRGIVTVTNRLKTRNPNKLGRAIQVTLVDSWKKRDDPV